ALLTGTPYSSLPFDDLMAKVASGQGDLLPAETRRLSDLVTRVAETYDGLLPDALEQLVVKDDPVMLEAALQSADHWTDGGRHYVRLRHFDGRAQVVETAPYVPASPYQAGQTIEILLPGDSGYRGTGQHVFEAYGLWFFRK